VYKEVRYHHILKNLLKKDKEVKVIGLVRNPFSVVNSWLNAPREFRKDLGWNELEEWRFAKKKNLNKVEEFNGYEKWKEVTLLFEELKKIYPERFYILKYDELLRSTESGVKDLFEFCDLDFQNQTKHFLFNSTNNDQSKEAYSVFRKNQVDDNWKTQLNTTIISEIKEDLKIIDLEKYI